MALAIGGCIIEVDFDPVGTDAEVEGSWLINGEVPTAANCSAIGISNVRVRFYDGGSSFDHSDLVFPCADGGFLTSGAVLKEGVYDLQVLGIDGSGQIIAEGPRETYTATFGGRVTIRQVDFVAEAASTTVRASWTINGGAASAASCDAAGIATVSASFNGGSPVAVACSTGGFVADIDPGAYDVVVHAVDAGGNNITSMGFEQSFTIAEGGDFTLNAGNAIDFVLDGFSPLGTDAGLAFNWSIGTTPASTAACEVTAGVTVEIEFYDLADTARAEGVIVAMGTCDDGTFVSSGNILANGSYLASIIMRNAGGTEIAGTDLDETFVVAGGTLDMGNLDIRLQASVVSFALEWTNPSDTNTVVGCGTGNGTDGPSSMSWTLVRDDGISGTVAFQSTSEMDACESRLTFTTPETVTPGTYWMEFEGNEVGTPKAWSLIDDSCSVEIVAEGDLSMGICKAPYI